MQLREQYVAAVIPRLQGGVNLVRPVDLIDGSWLIPQTSFVCQYTVNTTELAIRNLLLDGHVVADAAEFALESDSGGVVRTRVEGVERCAALGVCIMVIVLMLLVRCPRDRSSTEAHTLKSPSPWSNQPDVELINRVGSSFRTRSVNSNSG